MGLGPEPTRPAQAARAIALISSALVDAMSYEEGIEVVLSRIAEGIGAQSAEAWTPEAHGAYLRRGPQWHQPSEALDAFERASAGLRFAPGEGLPGRIWARREPEWIVDVSEASAEVFRRAPLAQRAGLRTACGIPVFARNRVLLILAFYMQDYREESGEGLEWALAGAGPIGLFLQRLQAEDRLRRCDLPIDASPIFTSYIDRQYRYRAVSGQYGREFQRRREDMVGKTVEELLGKKIFTRLKPHIDRALGGEAVHLQAWIPLPASGRRYMDISYTPHRAGDEPTGCVVTARDITELRRAERALRASREQLRRLAGRLAESREEERREVAREIHDELGQGLTALRMDIEHHLDTSGVRTPEAPPALLRRTDELIDLVNRLASELRPPALEELGLEDALVSLVDEFAARVGLKVEVSVNIGGIPPSWRRDIGLYRIVQEALTNAARHARASRVELGLSASPRGLRLVIRDDGRGIERAEAGSRDAIGLIGMRERALALGGELTIRRHPRGGTVVRVDLPTDQPARENVP